MFSWPHQPGSSLLNKPAALSCLARHLALGVLQLAFFCCSQSLISPDEIPQGQAAVWTLFLAYLPGHLVGEREQLGAPASQPGVLGPLYLDQDANWQQPLPLPFADVAEHRGHLDGLEGHLVAVLRMKPGSENLLCVSWARAEAQLICGRPALPALDRGSQGAQ